MWKRLRAYLEFLLNRVPRRKSRCPSPLKIEAAEVAGHVDDLADEVETWAFARRHGLRGKLGRVHTAGGDLGLFEAFGAGRRDAPSAQRALDRFYFTVG